MIAKAVADLDSRIFEGWANEAEGSIVCVLTIVINHDGLCGPRGHDPPNP